MQYNSVPGYVWSYGYLHNFLIVLAILCLMQYNSIPSYVCFMGTYIISFLIVSNNAIQHNTIIFPVTCCPIDAYFISLFS